MSSHFYILFQVLMRHLLTATSVSKILSLILKSYWKWDLCFQFLHKIPQFKQVV